MTQMTLTLVMQAAMLASGAASDTDSYTEAQRDAMKTGRPVVVLVGAEWCPACVTMKKNVIPQIKEEGHLDKVNFALVDLDKEGELGRQLISGGKIPQLLMFRKTDDGWKLRRLVGGQSPAQVKRFIGEGIELDEKETASVKKAMVQAVSSTTDGQTVAR